MKRGGVSARYRFFGGKGGVGKTTCAAAAAITAAQNGHRVLVVSTDPAHSLGDAFQVRLGRAARRIPLRGELYAAELDADRALVRWLAGRRPTLRLIAGRGTYLDDEDIDRFLGLAVPGVDELIGLLELTRLADARAYDEIVVDTAPTGHTLRLLDMPETLRRIAAVLDDMQAKHRFLGESLRGAHRQDVADALIAEIDTHAQELAARLRDPARARFAWVMLAEQLALDETVAALRTLEASGIVVTDVIVNRVATAGPSCAFCDARVRAERQMLAVARRAFAGRRVVTLREADREPRGIPALSAIGRAMLTRTADSDREPRRAARPMRPRVRLARGAGDWIDRVAPADLRLIRFGGKGGVGKTSCAAATALAVARRDPARQVLLLSTDPAHSLGHVLRAEIGDEERSLPAAPPNLRARELDADRAWRDRCDRYRKAVDDVFGGVLRGSSFEITFDRAVVRELLELAPPGLDELFGVLTVVDALGRSERPYDVVVVDTAPTGHALRLLRMPGAALEWVRAFLATILKYRAVIGLGEFAADLVEVSRDLRRLQQLLADARQTRFVTVTRAAELPRAETLRLLSELRRLHIAAPVTIVNGVRRRGCPRCDRAARIDARQLRELGAGLRTVARRATPAATSVVLAPLVAPPPLGPEALTRWSGGFTVEPAA